jgi:mono/diheme cytochrome c family protein
MLFGLSTTSQVALATAGGIFILFSLVCSFVLPRKNPDFPGTKWRNAFVALCIALFIGMMSTVLIYGKEEEEAEATGETIATTESGETTTEAKREPGPYDGGDAAAGKTVFVNTGCGACHVLSAGGGTGSVGPNLDETNPDEALIVDRVLHGKGAMQPYEDTLSEKQIADVVAFVDQSTQG